MGAALDQPVALHALERVGHRRLFDIQSLHEVALGQPLFAPEFEQAFELRRCQPHRFDALGQRLGEEPSLVIGEVGGGARGVKILHVHGLSSGRIVWPLAAP